MTPGRAFQPVIDWGQALFASRSSFEELLHYQDSMERIIHNRAQISAMTPTVSATAPRVEVSPESFKWAILLLDKPISRRSGYVWQDDIHRQRQVVSSSPYLSDALMYKVTARWSLMPRWRLTSLMASRDLILGRPPS